MGADGEGYLAANFTGIGTDCPALQDVIEHVVEPGDSQAAPEDVGNVPYNRGLWPARPAHRARGSIGSRVSGVVAGQHRAALCHPRPSFRDGRHCKRRKRWLA